MPALRAEARRPADAPPLIGVGLGRVKVAGPLVAARVSVSFASEQSSIRLPSGEVEKPVWVRDYGAGGGTITPLP